ncbi:MAG: DUF4912 domain-containing protein [Elusimicrobia bacterium]|nr:DUF4912 domain-containing protein [Elusimicrobiota bacterium]
MTRLVILPRDPRWMHAYWEVAPYTWEEARKQFGDILKQGRSVLRVHSQNAGKDESFDVDVNVDARNWYVFSPHGDGEWHAQLGLILPDGRFVLLAISNKIRLPAGQVSDLMDEKWGIIRTDWERLFELSGGGRLGAGSLDLVKMLAQRWDLLQNVSSASLIPGSPPPPRPGAPVGGDRRPFPKKKDFGLWPTPRSSCMAPRNPTRRSRSRGGLSPSILTAPFRSVSPFRTANKFSPFMPRTAMAT